MTNTIRRQIDYTKKDYTSLRDDLLALARERLPEWTDHSPNDLGVVLVELFSHLGDVLLYYQDRIANESYLDTAVERRSVIDLLRLIGYELRPPQPASAALTLLFENSVTATGAIIPKGTIFSTTKQSAGEKIQFQYVLNDLNFDIRTLPLVSYEGLPYRGYVNKLPVIQVDDHVQDADIGTSNGSRKQRFMLLEKPLIDGQLEVAGKIGDTRDIWERRDSLLYSLSADKHYTVYRDENDHAWVEFGDGQYGKIPTAGSHIKASYRTGGGIKGNVPARTITNFVVDSKITNLKHVFNEQAATAGADAESSEDAVTKAPRLFRAMRRAVTLQDYEDYAKQFGIGKARARPGTWNVVELCVAPVGGGYPTDTLKADLRTFFEDKRMVTYVVEVTDPVYVPLHIEGNLAIEPFYFTDEVRQKAENAVRDLFAYDNVNFEDKVYLSKIYEAIEAIEGVAGVTITRFEREGDPKQSASPTIAEQGVITFGWNEIPVTAVASGILLKKVTGGSRA